ncbi:MAG: CheR family methyltransferase [Terriglobia bacterium]
MALSAAEFEYVRTLLREHSALSMDEDKQYLVESRLEPLAQEEGFPSLQSLILRLKSEPSTSSLHRKVVDAMTTNETSFFRDVRPFRLLEQLALPQLVTRRASERSLNIWCAASSSGQEPYSVAMLLRESFPTLVSWRIRLIASDISDAMLCRCRIGRYSQLEVDRGLPAAMRVKYFRKVGTEWEIDEEVRRMVEFHRINLIDSWPGLPSLDLIMMRNVLIYFEVERKKEILEKARSLLRADGYLLLGGAETTLNIDDFFEPIQFAQTSCYQLRKTGAQTLTTASLASL